MSLFLGAREHLKTESLVAHEHDLLVFHAFAIPQSAVRVFICFVPDRETLRSECFTRYAAALADSSFSLEKLAKIILEDLLNVLIPRYVQVEVTQQQAEQFQRVLVEEKQSKWDNSGLLSHIAVLKPKT